MLAAPTACGLAAVPGDDNKRDPDMDNIGCLGSNGQHSQILPFRVTFNAVTRYRVNNEDAYCVSKVL